MSPTSYQTAPPRVGGLRSGRSTKTSASKIAGPPGFETGPIPSPDMRWWVRTRSAIEERRASTDTELVATPRMERALVALAVYAQQLDDRLERIERRIDDAAEAMADGPTHADVLEVRVHSARVAAELARVTVELRAEIERAAMEAGARREKHQDRVNTLAEQIIDLSDALDTQPGDVARSRAS